MQRSWRKVRAAGVAFIALTAATWTVMAGQDVSQMPARPSPDWLRSGTIYEIFARDFSAAGNLNGVTARSTSCTIWA